ncbi:hypothetical protein GTH32_14990 [Alteromonas sp. 345S023]|uniref:Uncharacterized protein n=1 Tax=Alteromonas profundi TaxID=2696062 RepID=A0A7X5LN99_9ALTE|nr:hypothetical protein [Alteromonas profundi]NDV92481.1 hypothetical protein [Alteromonas profundi]
MATSSPSHTHWMYSFVQSVQQHASSVGTWLWMANVVLLVNVVLVLSGTMAEASEFVSAIQDNVVIEPYYLALLEQTLSQFISPVIILVLFGLKVHSCATARAAYEGDDRPLPFVFYEYPQPFIQQLGSRAPPIAH